MTTPDDARGAFLALLNQIPDSMVASRIILTELSELSSVKGQDGEVSAERLHSVFGNLINGLALGFLALENRMDKLENRPGITDGALDAIFTEFGLSD